MIGWYYRIWVDAINFEQKKNGDSRNWKLFTIIPISIAQGINLLVVFLTMSWLGLSIDIFINIELFRIEFVNKAISGLLTMLAPFMVLNYIFIFKDDKYKEIMKRYEPNGGKSYAAYFVSSFLLLILPIAILKLLS